MITSLPFFEKEDQECNAVGENEKFIIGFATLGHT